MVNEATLLALCNRSLRIFLRRVLICLAALGALSLSTLAAAAVTITTPVFTTLIWENKTVPTTPATSCNYFAYKITTDATARPDVWVKLSTFAGGTISLAPNEDGVMHLGAIAANSTKAAFFYLCGNSTVTAPPVLNQTHNVAVFDRDPGLTGVVTLAGPTSVNLSYEQATINANSNKVNGVTVSPTNGALGTTVTLTVTGNTGTVGAAERLVFTPSALSDWRADVFELQAVTLTMPGSCGVGGPSVIVDDFTCLGLSVSGANTPYTLVYTFRVMSVLTTPITAYPFSFIDSGQSLKFADPLPAVFGATDVRATVAKSASPSIYTLPAIPGNTTFTLTYTAGTSSPTTFDQIVDLLPAAMSYVAGSASTTCDILPRASLGDPFISGANELRWDVLATIPASSSCTVSFSATVSAIAGSYNNCTYALVGQVPQPAVTPPVSNASVIDADTFATNFNPACATVLVNPAPVLNSLTINKTTQGGDATFAFNLTGGPPTATPSVTTSGGIGSTSVPSLISGNTYTLTETALTGWDPSGTVSCTGATVTAATASSVTFTQTAVVSTCSFSNVKRGSISITKSTDPASDTTTQFGFITTPPVGAATTFQLVGGGSNTSGNLVPGVYTVVEDVLPAGWSTVVSITCNNSGGSTSTDSSSTRTANITVAPGGATTCTYFNRKQSTLRVAKALVPAADPGRFDLSGTGVTTVTAVGNGGTTGTSVLTNAGTLVTASEVANGATSLANYGTTVSCVDTSNGNAALSPQVGSTTTSTIIQLGANQAVVCTYTNTRLVAGDLVITKNVSGGPVGGVSGTFGFSANCGTDGTFAGSVSLTSAITGSGNISGIPAGAVCSVSETTLPVPAAGYSWGTTPSAQSVTVAPTTGGSVTFSNSLSANAGSITVSKTITGVAASAITANLSFPFSIACSTPTASYSGSVTVNANALSGSTTVAAVPAGSSACAITEGTQPTAPTGYTWGTPTYTQPTGTMAAGGTLTGTVFNPLAAQPLAPPMISKAGLVSNASTGEISWTINVGNTDTTNTSRGTLALTLTDPLPTGTSFVAGSVACASTGGTVIASCAFDSVASPTSVVVTASLPFGAGVVVTVKTVSPGASSTIINVASASFDLSPGSTRVAASAVIAFAVQVVPTLDRTGLLFLIAALLAVGMGLGLRQKTEANARR